MWFLKMITGIEAEFCIMKHLREVPLLFSPSFLLPRNKPLCFPSAFFLLQVPVILLSGDSEKCLLAFSHCAECFLIHGPCVCGQEWGGSALPWGPSLSVSGLLGQEPWEAGGLNNEEPEPRDLARFVIYSVKPSFSGEILFRPTRENWKPLHKHWSSGGSRPALSREVTGLLPGAALSAVRSLVFEKEHAGLAWKCTLSGLLMT